MQRKEKTRKKLLSKERISRLPAIILLSLILPVMIYIVAPFEIYCNNLGEMHFSVWEFIGIQTIYAIGLFVLLFCLFFFIPEKAYGIVYPLCVGILLMLFVQSNYLNVGLKSLAGDDVGDKISPWTYVWNTAVWIVVLTGVVLAFRFVKAKNAMRLGALVLTVAIAASQILNFVVVSVNTAGAYDSAVERAYGKYEENPRFLTNKNLTSVGKNRNVVVFCIDRFDAVLFAEPAMKKYPKLFAKLDGFTYYRDATSLYGNTFPAVGYMLSGIEYDNSGDHEEYFRQVYYENKTLTKLKDEGYAIHLYAEDYYDYTNANELPDYVNNIVETNKDSLTAKVRKPFNFGLALTKMSLYRSLPFLLKRGVGGVTSSTCNEYISYVSNDLQGFRNFSCDLKRNYQDVKKADGNFTADFEKNFSFIHVAGCHNAEYDVNWKKSGKRNCVISAKNSMELVTLYLQNMKKISPELYRDSTIVILGDHGKVYNRTQKFKDAMLTALFVKPAGIDGREMTISSAPVSHENLWATIFESEGIDYDATAFKPSVFHVEAEFARSHKYPERKFIWNKRKLNMTSYDSIVYKINGEARDFGNWKIESSTYYDHPLFAN